MKTLEMTLIYLALVALGSTVIACAALVSPSVHENPVHGTQRQQSCSHVSIRPTLRGNQTYTMVNNVRFCKCHEILLQTLHTIWKHLASSEQGSDGRALPGINCSASRMTVYHGSVRSRARPRVSGALASSLIPVPAVQGCVGTRGAYLDTFINRTDNFSMHWL